MHQRLFASRRVAHRLHQLCVQVCAALGLSAGEYRCAMYTHACVCQCSAGSCPLRSLCLCSSASGPVEWASVYCTVGAWVCVCPGAVGMHLCARVQVCNPHLLLFPSMGAVQANILTCVCTWSSRVCLSMHTGVCAPSRASLTHACTVSSVAQVPWPAAGLS